MVVAGVHAEPGAAGDWNDMGEAWPLPSRDVAGEGVDPWTTSTE